MLELGEFISDKYYGTHLQESILETIGDLALGLHNAGISRKVARLRPIGVVKG